MSKIEISVEWENSTVFAGEEVKCSITFTNTTQRAALPATPASAEQARGPTSARERWKLDLPSQPSSANATLARPNEPRSADGKPTRHRPTLSLNVPVKSPGSGSANAGENKTSSRAHKRSVSILSIGQQSTPAEDRDGTTRVTPIEHVRNSHARSVSVEGLSVRRGSLLVSPQVPQSAPPQRTQAPGRSSTIPGPMQISRPTNDGNSEQAATGPSDRRPRRQSKSQTPPKSPFPDVQPRHEPESLGLGVQPNNANTSVNGSGIRRHNSQRVGRVSAASTSGDPTNRSLQRVMSPAGGESTPRSSMDIYSHSNHSSDTLQSEYVAPINLARPLMHRRDGSQLGPSRPDSQTLMMGYVQLVGLFTLEGSLVNMAPFEAVKRKAIIGGQGSGGVVGIETARRDHGLFGSLGWGSIGQSLGGLLGPEEPSSIREMKGIASSKSIPIISTAQSILFVDLQLRPGESKQFTYSHSLPQGIPPTFKGRAIKCSYHIVVGTQRPHHSRAQQPGRPQHSVRQIEVPFKVQPAINEAGEVLGHDLMNPHVILRDMSKTQSLDTADAKSARRPAAASMGNEGDAEFKAYVQELLEGTRKDSGAGLLSPTSTVPMYASPAGHPAKVRHPQVPAKELIDMAIAQHAASGSARTGSTSLQISRGGEKVAKVLLARTAFRVGETVVGSVDFSGADVACFTFNAALESAEVVDPAIALRSGASIHRATRRVHAHTSENTVCAERVSFALTIPPSATPDFFTSGVRLEWKLRLEFVTADTQLGESMKDLLEINEEGERGVFSSATQELPYQSFEVPVALRIYGNVGGNSETSSAQGYRI